jgi:hypothetical protein
MVETVVVFSVIATDVLLKPDPLVITGVLLVEKEVSEP